MIRNVFRRRDAAEPEMVERSNGKLGRVGTPALLVDDEVVRGNARQCVVTNQDAGVCATYLPPPPPLCSGHALRDVGRSPPFPPPRLILPSLTPYLVFDAWRGRCAS